MSDPFGNDPFISLMHAELDKINKKYSETKGIRAKSNLLNEAYHKSIVAYLQQMKNIDTDVFDNLFNERVTTITNIAKLLPEKLMKFNLEGMDIETIGSIALSLEPELHLIEKIGEEVDKIDLGIEEYQRLFLTEFLSKFEFYYIIIGLIVELIPLFKLSDITEKRFGSDYNWAIAVSILATQENLVKKKLIDLGMAQIEIEKFLKDKGGKFSNLVDLLAEKIKEKEGRRVNLSFYKSSTIREVRNKIEHEGYDVQVRPDDVSDLLNDVEKFDKELFLDKK